MCITFAFCFRAYGHRVINPSPILVHESNRKISEIARELVVRPELLYRWKSGHTADPEQSFPGRGHMKPLEEYIRHLERELAQARQERDILKKPLAYFFT